MPRLLSRLFGKSDERQPRVIEATICPGNETLEVVGESRYQDALWKVVGGFRREPIRDPVDAVLLPESNNRYDTNAIMVLVDGQLVGYLAREDAAKYRPGLLRLMRSCPTGHVALHAWVIGGGPRGDGVGFLGVFLDHNPADFGIAPHYTSGGSLRTGLSEAIATDLDDERYDLSWLRSLDEDDLTAVGDLRNLLDNERDPIDRHYMFCELEPRLYRSREESASALDEFDAICAQHDREMDKIRQALLQKFGVVPVIEMYRQAAIRWQKAKQWEAARDWAQRGIHVYGDEAARPEVVDDLHKRVSYANKKIELRSQPRVRERRPVRMVTAVAVSSVETLVCQSCGATFERERTRGRKPKICPACRDVATPTTPQ